MMIQGETIKYSKQKAREKRTEETRLEKEITKMEMKFLASKQESDHIKLEALKNELEERRRPIIEGLITRSRVSWHEEGERSKKYVFVVRKEKLQYEKYSMYSRWKSHYYQQ